MDPSSPEYPFELQRLQIQYRASQENLRVAQEAAEAHLILFQQEREYREARFQEQLDEARRGFGSSKSDKGKRKE
jgi:hypothetical protein